MGSFIEQISISSTSVKKLGIDVFYFNVKITKEKLIVLT